MAYNLVLSSILRSYWLIDKSFAESQMPIIGRMIKGEVVSFEKDDDKKESFEKHYGVNLAANSYRVRPGSNVAMIPSGSNVIISISGPLMKSGGMCSYGMKDYGQLLAQIGSADNIKGVLLDIDSPGGQAYGTSDLAYEIKQLNSKKPVLAVINDGYAASAAMWIASACREIYTTKSTDKVGSIGVYTSIADYNKHYKEYFKLDVKDIYAPQSTDKNKSYSEAIAGNEDELKADLSVLAEAFISTIKENRGERLTSDEWNTGKMYYSEDALRIGLIDGTMPFEKVLERLDTLSTPSTKKQISKTNTMAFEKTLAVAKAESFAVVEGGFLLTEENLTAIETELANGATLQEQVSGYQTAATADAETIEANERRISELMAEVEALQPEASGDGTVLPIAGDPGPQKKMRSYNDPNSAINRKADRRFGR